MLGLYLGFAIYCQIGLPVIQVNFEDLPVITGTVNSENARKIYAKCAKNACKMHTKMRAKKCKVAIWE